MITILLLLLILISIWIGFYQLVKQQGRILLRLDKLEKGSEVAHSVHENAESQAAPDEFLGTNFPLFKFPGSLRENGRARGLSREAASAGQLEFRVRVL